MNVHCFADGIQVQREIPLALHLKHAGGVELAVERIHAKGGRAGEDGIARFQEDARQQVY